jgi:hypothetical protein
VLGELVGGRRQQRGAVASGVGAERAGCGHGPTLPS